MNDNLPDIHRSAAAYAGVAEAYQRGRPDYPPEVLDWLREDLRLAAGMTVVDLGAGTGKFTRSLLAIGATVIAIEPVAPMLAKLAAAHPEAQALVGVATAIPLADASVDVVVCAQSFHWFATPAALAEILRILRPGGRLGLIWNMRDARVHWVAHLDAIVNLYEGHTPRYYTGAWRAAFPFPGFGPFVERHFTHGHTGPADHVIINRVLSTSFVAALPEEERVNIEDELIELIETEPALAGKAVVTVPYVTAAFVCVKGG